jgi:predicted lipoprotein with Yx(FWY)xxD motif
MLRFKVLLLSILVFLLAFSATAQDDTLISLGSSDMYDSFLVGPNGLTLYMFTRDPLGETVCYDQCAERWPPLLVESEDEITVAEGIPGTFSTVERTDGTLQVAWNGMPLYYWQRDEAPGDTNGQGVGNVWWILPPATVYAFRHGDTAPVLVDANGMTLYTFDNDEEGVSNCVDDCATNWPPLTVESADDLVAGVNVIGALDTIEREDGSLQVTYNGMPLYYFAEDAAPGDMTGDGRGDVWHIVTPETLSTSSSDELGTFLVAANGMTVYTFANDEEGVSNCNDECAENWPPVVVDAADTLLGSADVTGELGTITRADESIQLTYNGMPLYYFAEDAAPSDTTGQGRGDVWFVVEP